MVDPKVPRLLRTYWQFKYATLLIVLLVVLVLMPVLGQSLKDHGNSRLAFLAVLVACVLATARTKAVMVLSAVLAVAGELTSQVPFAKGCHVLLFFLVSAIVLADVMRVEDVSGDKILGAICGYLLLGFGFAILYGLLATAQPGSFSVAEPSFSVLTYFSFVTISTLGYGDVLATSEASRALVTVESLTGQFYIAIVVARLVSLHMMPRSEPSTIEPDQPPRRGEP
jgi:hypothetical protein